MIWLVGNRGMLGREIEELLQERGLPFAGTDREVDITDSGRLRAFARDRSIEWIINCAAYTAVDRAEDEPDAARAINAEGPGKLADVAREKGIKLIHISTDYVYDGTKASPYTEDDDTGPLSVYGKSKLEGEHFIRDVLAGYYILRTAWLFGRYGGNFVHTMLHLFNEKDIVEVVADQRGSPTYSFDLAETVLRIVEQDSDRFGIYHYTNRGDTSWFGFANEIYRISRRRGIISRDVRIMPVTSDAFPRRAARPQNSVLSKAKIEETFGLKIPLWQDALERFLDRLAKR